MAPATQETPASTVPAVPVTKEAPAEETVVSTKTPTAPSVEKTAKEVIAPVVESIQEHAPTAEAPATH